MNKNKREEFEHTIWCRIETLIEERKVKQSQLVQLCKEIGMPVTQPELSKLYSRNKKINIYELTAISKALGVSVDFFVSGVAYHKNSLPNGNVPGKLLCRADDEAFSSYFGDYYIYYNATTEQEDSIQCGKMTIYEDEEGYCKVELTINVGIYLNQEKIVKKYEGHMLITTLLSGAYIIVRNDSIGELCFMIMRYRPFTVKQVECRILLCLTIGAGESKLPTVHRMLISRNELSAEQIRDSRSYLNLYGNAIRIEKNKALELKEALDEGAEKQALENLLNLLPERQYYEVSIELLRRHLHLDREKFAVFIANLLSLAETEPYLKIRETDDNLAYAIFARQTDFRSDIPPDD